MILSRSPLRITLGGGGTDLPSYYRHHEGFLIAGAIDKFIYVTINRPFAPGIHLKYSKIEEISLVSEVDHRIIREVLEMQSLKTPQIEITTLADVPAGTGLGSSGSFTCALLKAIYSYRRKFISTEELAKLACHIELDRLLEPIGKQDQYIAAYGGINCFTFHRDDRVTVEPLKASRETIFNLEDHLLLFFTGHSRKAGSILVDQNSRTQQNDKEMISNLHYVKDLGLRSKEALESGRLDTFGKLMHEHWEHKKNRSIGMSSKQINEWYSHGIRNGALGGKIVGAGGGGFLMFLAEDRTKLRNAMKELGLEEMRFHFDYEGTKILMT